MDNFLNIDERYVLRHQTMKRLSDIRIFVMYFKILFMKSKNLFITFAFTVALYSCSRNKSSNFITEIIKSDSIVTEVIVNGNKVNVLSLNDLKTNIQTIPLSKLVENCSLIQLENVDTEDRWATQDIVVTEKYIGVRYAVDRYRLFDRSGKFLSDIPSPKDYDLYFSDSFIDDKNELIYFTDDDRKISLYKTSGSLVKEILTPRTMRYPRISVSDGILTVIQTPNRWRTWNYPGINVDSVVIQFDVNSGDVLNEIAPPAQFMLKESLGRSFRIYSRKNVSGIFDIQHSAIDTLYHFDVYNHQIVPVFTITSRLSSVMTLPFRNHFQLNRNLIVSCTYNNDRGMIETMIATDLRFKTASWVKVVNDYFGNIPVANECEFINGYYVQCMRVKDFIYDIKKRLADRNCTERDKKKLNEILATLDKDGNNVVFIGKLKN